MVSRNDWTAEDHEFYAMALKINEIASELEDRSLKAMMWLYTDRSSPRPELPQPHVLETVIE